MSDDNEMNFGGTPFPLGAVKDRQDKRDFAFSKLAVPVQIPARVDYEHLMSPVKDQGNRGSCVAFATVAVKEYQEKTQRRRVKDPYNFSEEWIYQQIALPGGGAYIRDGLKALQKTGVPREHLMPYDKTATDDDLIEFKPRAKVRYNASYYKARAYARLNTLNEMKQSLAQNGPFVLGIDWRYSWFYPTRHIDGYPVLEDARSGFAGGHAIAVVGYDDAAGMVKIKNSWGEEWGKGGYALLPYDVLKNDMLDAWASIDISHVKNSVLNELLAAKDKTGAT